MKYRTQQLEAVAAQQQQQQQRQQTKQRGGGRNCSDGGECSIDDSSVTRRAHAAVDARTQAGVKSIDMHSAATSSRVGAIGTDARTGMRSEEFLPRRTSLKSAGQGTTSTVETARSRAKVFRWADESEDDNEPFRFGSFGTAPYSRYCKAGADFPKEESGEEEYEVSRTRVSATPQGAQRNVRGFDRHSGSRVLPQRCARA